MECGNSGGKNAHEVRSFKSLVAGFILKQEVIPVFVVFFQPIIPSFHCPPPQTDECSEQGSVRKHIARNGYEAQTVTLL